MPEENTQSFLAYQLASVKKNWRTFATCALLAGAAWIALFPSGWDEWTVTTARALFVGLLPVLGIVTKDASVTGTAHEKPAQASTDDDEKKEG